MVRFYGNQPTLLVSFPLTCQRCNSWEFHGANGVDCCCFFWLKGNWGCATSHGVASDLWQGFHPTLYALPPRWSSLIQDAWGYLHSHWTRRLGWWLMVGFVWQCFLFWESHVTLPYAIWVISSESTLGCKILLRKNLTQRTLGQDGRFQHICDKHSIFQDGWWA